MQHIHIMRQFIVITFLLMSSIALAERAEVSLKPSISEQTQIYLHTVDLGQDIAEKYGHTQIRVWDPVNRSDLTYTFGLYDFNAPNFVYNFVKGILVYRAGVFRTADAIAFYKRDGRAVWEDRLNLTYEQKLALVGQLRKSTKPENSSYRYQYFFNNCTTKPRDLINKALGNSFYDETLEKLSPFTYRETVRMHQATTILSGLFLEIIMNSRLDRQMSKWQEMYLPKSLRQVMLETPVHVGSDRSRGKSKLLTPVREIVSSPTPTANYRRDYVAMWLWAILPLVLLGYFLYVFPLQKWSYTFWGIYNCVWGLVAGSLGAAMLWFWGNSEHLDLHHNANLWLLWPTDFVYILYGLPFVFCIIPGRLFRWWFRVYAAVHLLAVVFLISCIMLGLIEQDLSRTMLTIGLISIILNVLILLVPTRFR